MLQGNIGHKHLCVGYFSRYMGVPMAMWVHVGAYNCNVCVCVCECVCVCVCVCVPMGAYVPIRCVPVRQCSCKQSC